MDTASCKEPKKATQKSRKISRSRLEISQKVIAFQELISLERTEMSEREVTKLLEVPRTTMRSWRRQEGEEKLCPELSEFLSGHAGKQFLQRIVMAAYQTLHYGSGGIRGLQEFLHLSKLSGFIAASEGALQEFSCRCEEYIVSFANMEEDRLANGMRYRKVTAVLDEMFRGRHPCLVAIEAVSGYILLEKFTEDRTAKRWKEELQPRAEKLRVGFDQIVSDLCGAIRACAKEMGAEHIPELFHSQYEISKATSGALAAKERESERELEESEEKLKRIEKRYGEDSDECVEAKRVRNLRKCRLEVKRERSKKVKEAKRRLGEIDHPMDLRTGKLQTAEIIKQKFDEQLDVIVTCAQDASLSRTCLNRLAKARRAFDAIAGYIKFFFVWYTAFVVGLNLSSEQTVLFNEVIFPLSYLKMIWKRLPKEKREELSKLKNTLEHRLKAAFPEGEQTELIAKGRECAEKFQRSSSCVEGRNSMLSLYHHRFHRLNPRSIRALTVVHNFHITRADGSTAAERFFGAKHPNLFESLVKNVRIPGKPRVQYHDPQRRSLGRQKRKIA